METTGNLDDVQKQAQDFLRWSLCLLPLTTQVAGCIEQLEYDDRGGLRVRARVDHEQARRCQAFSIACSVTSYQIVNPERPDFHAVIEGARLDEISLTDYPANPRALVTQRSKPCMQAEFYDNMLQLVSMILQGY